MLRDASTNCVSGFQRDQHVRRGRTTFSCTKSSV